LVEQFAEKPFASDPDLKGCGLQPHRSVENKPPTARLQAVPFQSAHQSVHQSAQDSEFFSRL